MNETRPAIFPPAAAQARALAFALPLARHLALPLALLLLTSCTELNHTRRADTFIDIQPSLAARAAATLPGNLSQPASTPDPPLLPPAGAIPLSPQAAIFAALQNQPALAVEKLDPLIYETYEQQQRAVFDPVLSATLQTSRARAVSPDLPAAITRSEALSAQIGVAQTLPTGTRLGVALSADYADRFTPAGSEQGTRAELSITQSLLRGASLDANLASLRQARLDILSSEYELRAYVASLVQDVELAYWDYALAKRRIEIYEESLQIAQQQLDEATEMVNVGRLAQAELAAAEAEVAQRRVDLINANASLQILALQLLRLIGPTSPDLWDRPIVLLAEPFAPQGSIAPVQEHVQLAMNLRSDLRQAKLQIDKGTLQLIKTRNGLLPQLDLFITLGKSGYARSFAHATNNITTSSSYDAAAGLTLQYPLFNRDASAQHRRATYSRQQAIASLENMQRLAIVDVRTAHIQLRSTREQITATAATRKLQQTTLDIETEKFRLGQSTSLLVAQAQRDLLSARIEEVNALVSHLKAAVNLFAEEGSLLTRRGIVAPGSTPPPATTAAAP